MHRPDGDVERAQQPVAGDHAGGARRIMLMVPIHFTCPSIGEHHNQTSRAVLLITLPSIKRVLGFSGTLRVACETRYPS
jgi:hypothetical protein